MDLPPTKKRKLSIRSRQSTLDLWANSATRSLPAINKPPTQIKVTQPHGRLVQKVNGVQHVLNVNEDELATTPPPAKRVARVTPQPTGAEQLAKKDEKRTLRSQDEGPRLKSELAIYFPNYEDVIFDVQKEPDFITVDSALYVTEDAVRPRSEQSTPTKGIRSAKSSPSHTRKTSVNGMQSPGDPTRDSSSKSQFNGSAILDMDVITRNLPEEPEDPLTDEYYLKSHRRAERKEKQLRNIEKERAMHEKVQLDRILEGLQGHDWLKVLGITGITDSEAKKYEVKRDYFIAEVKALVDKFKQWKEQERKQKYEKEVAVTQRDGESEEPASDKSSEGPPSSDLNASAARQLQLETAIALKSITASQSKGKKPLTAQSPSKPPVQYEPPPPEDPITSFYEKRHLRDAALGKARHGRNTTAFGHPVPDLDEREFVLPAEYATEDAIRANAREKRRRKRESVANAAG